MGRNRKLLFEHLKAVKRVKCFVAFFDTMMVFEVQEKGNFFLLKGEINAYEIEIKIRNQSDIDTKNVEYLRE